MLQIYSNCTQESQSKLFWAASEEEIARYLSSIHVFNCIENSENKFGVPDSRLGTENSESFRVC